MEEKILIGPFRQLLPMENLPAKGPISDDQLNIIQNAGIVFQNGNVSAYGSFDDMVKTHKNDPIHEIEDDAVAIPGMIDPHTHICFAGSRSFDYSLRISGKSYLEIAKEGGGIWSTVQKTREASIAKLSELTSVRSEQLLTSGVTTAEVKSGYGLTVESELRMLEAIQLVNHQSKLDIVPTCLAAHIRPKDFAGSSEEYLEMIEHQLFSAIRQHSLCRRIDIFVEESAFNVNEALPYLSKAKAEGFDVTVHGDQFSTGGSEVAIQAGAVSVDHLESSAEKEIENLAKSNVVATVLPGASLGLGMGFAPARQLLDAGACLAIGSDWNPGSAPMGDLLLQAAILSAYEKLSSAETFAAIGYRAALALNLHDRGTLKPGQVADLIGFPCKDYREILYHQGKLTPNLVVKAGEIIH